MRNAFAEELTQLATDDPRIVLLSGDIGNRLFDKFQASFPSRFFNCGVAEANMASIAAGMAMAGLRPITYTITPFNTTRCLEQIRDDICYHNVPVIIIGTGAGLSYATLGCTHHSLEDISFLQSLPNMTVLCPGDAFELRALFRLALKHNGPIYMRIGKKGEPNVHTTIPSLEIGKGHLIRPGKEMCIISTGNMLPTALEVANHFGAQLVSMHTVKPLDTTVLADFPLVCTLEEHGLINGLGASIATWMVDHAISTTRLLRFGTRDEFAHPIGSQDFLRHFYGLTVSQIINKIETYANTSSYLSRDEPTFSHR